MVLKEEKTECNVVVKITQRSTYLTFHQVFVLHYVLAFLLSLVAAIVLPSTAHMCDGYTRRASGGPEMRILEELHITRFILQNV